MQRRSFVEKLRERVKGPPATKEEIDQLNLNMQREVLKTKMSIAKHQRPSLLKNVMFGGQPVTRGRAQGRRGTAYRQEPSLGFGSNSSESNFGGSMFSSENTYRGMDEMLGSGPAMKKEKGRQKKYEKPFGSGLDDMFGFG